MATMIPSSMSLDIKSSAEKFIFKCFKESTGTEDWIVLHSLGINNHQRVVHGEMDFLVLVPERGMFALEVKGGRVERKLGKWRFINKYGDYDEKIRGPFDQAWEGIYSIKSSVSIKLDEEHKHLKDMIFGIGVMFPDVEYESIGVDEDQWQVFDIRDGNNVTAFIERIAKGALLTRKRLGYTIHKEMFPTKADVSYIAQLLRGDFDITVPLRIKQKYTEVNLQTLSDEQAQCIEQLADNRRALVRGTAGTGKTMLAIEAVKRAVANGEKVAFFCYNRMLGNWLQHYFLEFPQEQRPAYIGSFHSYMKRILYERGVDCTKLEYESQESFFSRELPQMTSEVLRKAHAEYDILIVDEAQDLIKNTYLDVMGHCLKGGLGHGKWRMFGDFSMQAIYSPRMREQNFIELLQDKSNYTLFKLTKNCRNTRKICLEIENILGVKINTAFEDVIDTPAVDHIIYENMEDQKSKLVSLIACLLDNDVRASDIIVLSPRVMSDSVVNMLDEIVIKKYEVEATGYIRFSTIQAFKGLESSHIIITDINSYADEKLIYVGLSRARFALHILESKKACEERTRLFFTRRINNGR